MKKLVIDLDGTLTIDQPGPYETKKPNTPIIEALKKYHQDGYIITIFTARNMRTYDGNVGKINVHTLPTVIAWLEKHGVPFHEVQVGKPWCGLDGFYVDDKAVRPSEFASMSKSEIQDLLDKENNFQLEE